MCSVIDILNHFILHGNKIRKRKKKWGAFFHYWHENLEEPEEHFPLPVKQPDPTSFPIPPTSPSFPGDLPSDTPDRPREPPYPSPDKFIVA